MSTSEQIQTVRQAVESTGIWQGDQRYSHTFLLSPNAFELSAEQRRSLDRLAHDLQECLFGVSAIMGIAEQADLYPSTSGYTNLRRSLSLGTAYQLPNNQPAKLPMLRKCDLVVGTDGQLWLAEIDATNPRSWGYSIVGRSIVQTLDPQAQLLPGVAPIIAKWLSRQGVGAVTFLYGDTQRFYRPEFEIIASELDQLGIKMVVINESEVVVKDDCLLDGRSGEVLPEWLVDMPAMNRNKPLIDWLRSQIDRQQAKFLIPPKYFLGSKALLAMLSNPLRDQQLEHLLLSQIRCDTLERVRRFIPPAIVVGNKLTDSQLANFTSYHPTVLKAAVSSGMKGVVFSDEPGFAQALKVARNSKGSAILQHVASGRVFYWDAHDPVAERKLEPAEWQLRLTAYLSYTAVEDIAVTACMDKAVHGGSKAILTGTKLVS